VRNYNEEKGVNICSTYLGCALARYPLFYGKRGKSSKRENCVDKGDEDFLEKKLKFHNKYVKEGYNMKEAVELSNPKKYNELLDDHPHVHGNVSKQYLKDRIRDFGD